MIVASLVPLERQIGAWVEFVSRQARELFALMIAFEAVG